MASTTLERQNPDAGGRPGFAQKTDDSTRLFLPHANATRKEVCFNCNDFRAIRTSSRNRITFCAFTGERLHPGTPACSFFPGGEA